MPGTLEDPINAYNIGFTHYIADPISRYATSMSVSVSVSLILREGNGRMATKLELLLLRCHNIAVALYYEA